MFLPVVSVNKLCVKYQIATVFKRKITPMAEMDHLFAVAALQMFGQGIFPLVFSTTHAQEELIEAAGEVESKTFDFNTIPHSISHFKSFVII